jgi:Fe2+ or Zn2+ uptake regulation protein
MQKHIEDLRAQLEEKSLEATNQRVEIYQLIDKVESTQRDFDET